MTFLSGRFVNAVLFTAVIWSVGFLIYKLANSSPKTTGSKNGGETPLSQIPSQETASAKGAMTGVESKAMTNIRIHKALEFLVKLLEDFHHQD